MKPFMLVFAVLGFVGAAQAQSETTTCTGNQDSVKCTTETNPAPGNLGDLIRGHYKKKAGEKQAEIDLVFCQQNPDGKLTDRAIDCRTEIARVRAQCVVSPKEKICKRLN